MKTSSLIAAASMLAALHTGADAASFVPLDSKATYLHTNNESPPAPAALAFDFAAHGFAPGDTIHLQSSGFFDNGPGTESFQNIIALFSSSATLLAPTLLDRVPGALASNAPAYVTAPTYWGGQATDTAHDFLVNQTGVDVTIPFGASVLVIAAYDSWYQDNTDPNRDFGFMISAAAVPEPATWALWLAGFAAVAVCKRRRGEA